MKREYFKPELQVVAVDVEEHLLTVSIGLSETVSDTSLPSLSRDDFEEWFTLLKKEF